MGPPFFYRTKTMDINSIKIGCIGAGTMGGAIMESVAKTFGGKNIIVSAKHHEKAQEFASRIGGTAAETNSQVIRQCKIIFIAVKPAFVKEVLQETEKSFTEEKILVSMAAGVSLKTLHEALDSKLSASSEGFVKPHVIRIMPNLPAVYGEGMTAMCLDSFTTDEESEAVKKLLGTCGKVEIVPEKLMDGVTAVSGSGPAYGFIFIEALADAAVRFGMPRKQAYIYAAQTLKGAATMALEDSRSISELKDAVCSPSGTTIEAVISLERHNFRGTIIEAATAAYNKSIDLGRK